MAASGALRQVAVILLLLPVLLLSSCSPPRDGYVGIGRDAEGDLRVYVRTCHHPLDAVSLSWPDDPNAANSNEEVFAEWTINSQSDRLRAVGPLFGTATGEIVTVRPLWTLPAAPKNMALHGFTDDASFAADETDPPNRTVTLAVFDAIDCSQYG